MAALALVLGSVLVAALVALSFVVGYLLGAQRSEDPITLPEIRIPGRKARGRHKPKAMNEEQLAEREIKAMREREIAMTEQEAADLSGG